MRWAEICVTCLVVAVLALLECQLLKVWGNRPDLLPFLHGVVVVGSGGGLVSSVLWYATTRKGGG